MTPPGTTLVTGATGLVGNNVVRALLEREHPVRCLVRDGSDPRPLEDLDVEIAPGDVRDARAVSTAVEGVGTVVHAAALVRIGRTGISEMRSVNVGGTRAVADACLASGARLVHVSTVDTLPYGTLDRPTTEEDAEGPPPRPTHVPSVPYVVTKREAEAVVTSLAGRDGLDAVVVHPAFVLGPRDWKPSSGRLLMKVAGGHGIVAPPGGNDFCHAEDVATGIVRAAERGLGGRRYILSGEGLSYRQAFELFAAVTGGPRPRWTAPALLVRLAGRLGDLAGRATGSEPALNSGSAGLACLPHHFDGGRAARELGYASRPAREAAADAWAWFEANDYVRRR